MHYNELIQLYFERSGAILSLWTLYVVIVGGLLAFSSLRKAPDRFTTILISVLFAVFAYQNLRGLHDAAVQRLAVLQAIKQCDAQDAQVMRIIFEPTLTPVGYENIRGFHLTGDVLTLLTLWAMELRRRRTVAMTETRK